MTFLLSFPFSSPLLSSLFPRIKSSWRPFPLTVFGRTTSYFSSSRAFPSLYLLFWILHFLSLSAHLWSLLAALSPTSSSHPTSCSSTFPLFAQPHLSLTLFALLNTLYMESGENEGKFTLLRAHTRWDDKGLEDVHFSGSNESKILYSHLSCGYLG